MINCPFCNKAYLIEHGLPCKNNEHYFYHSTESHSSWVLKLNFLNAGIGRSIRPGIGQYCYVGTVDHLNRLKFSFDIEEVEIKDCYKTLLRYIKLSAFT